MISASAIASAVDTAPSSASISASEPVQVPVPMLLSLLVPVVHMPSSMPVHVQSKMSQLDDVTCLRVQHVQPVNMVNMYLNCNFRVYGENSSQSDQTGKYFSVQNLKPKIFVKTFKMY